MPRPHLGANRRLIISVIALTLILCLSLCGIAAPVTHAHQVDFPNWDGTNVLRRVQINIGSALDAYATYQSSSASYWIGASFDWPASSRVCRVGLRGWVRQQALTGEPLKLICDCRQPLLHGDTPTTCSAIAGLTK